VIDDSVPALSQSLNDVLARIASGVQGYRITAGALALAGSITAPAAGPVVTSIAPQGAVVSPTSTVTIAGRGFGATRGTVAFYPYTYTDLEGIVHQIRGTVTAWSDTTITCTMPDYSSSGPVLVTAGGIAATGFPFLAGHSYAGERVFGSSLTYRLNPNCLDPVDAIASVSIARASWSGVAGFSFVDGGLCSTVGTPTVRDNRNDIWWSSSFEEGSDVLAYNSYWVLGSYLVESDIVLNDYYAWGDGSGETFDVASVLAHEFGHGLVLGDQYGNGDRNKVMYGRVSPGMQKRALTAEDIAGIRAIYGGAPTLSGTTTFNRGSLYTSSTVVPIVSSISGATKMRAFNGAAFSPSMYTYADYAADASLSVPATDGPYAVKAEFLNASTGDAIVRYATVVLDRVAPAGTMVLEGDASTATTVAVTADSAITDTAPMEMRFSLDSRATWSAWEPYAATRALSLPPGNGTKYVYAQYRDAAGNTVERWDTIELAVPVTPSTTVGVNGTRYAPGDVTPWLASASVTLTVEPPTATRRYRIAGGSTVTYAGGFGMPGDGSWVLEYWSTDPTLDPEPTRTVTVRVDATPPTDLTSSATGTWRTTTERVVLGASDTVSGATIHHSTNGGPVTAYPAGGFDVSSQGTTTIDFYATDQAGNRTDGTRSYVLVDSVAPITTTTVPVASMYWGSASIGLSASDAHSGVAGTAWSVDGGGETSGTVASIVTIGTHTLRFHSHDVAGNEEAPVERAVVVTPAESAPPAELAAGAGVPKPKIELNWVDSSDNETGFELQRSMDGGPWSHLVTITAGIAAFTDTAVDWDPTYRYRVRSFTPLTAGSPSTATWVEAPQAIRLAESPPATVAGVGGVGYLDPGLTPWLVEALVTLRTDVPSATVLYVLDSAPESAYTTSFPVTGDGTHTITYRATAAGHDAETAHTLAVRVDASPPVTTANVGSLVSQPSLVLTAIDPPSTLGEPLSGVGQRWYAFDGGVETLYHPAAPPAVPRGVHSVAWHSHDVAGNEEVVHTGTIIGGPQAHVRQPAGRSSARVSRSLTFSGKLTRAANHRRLTLLAYRFNGADWVLTRTKSVLIHTPRRRGLSSYRGSIKFTAKGAWKVVARYEGDGYWVPSWSAPKYVTVK
jgi:hypothetical protein